MDIPTLNIFNELVDRIISKKFDDSKNKLIYYGTLAPYGPVTNESVGNNLGDINDKLLQIRKNMDDYKDIPLISSIVVRNTVKESHRIPGHGFWTDEFILRFYDGKYKCLNKLIEAFIRSQKEDIEVERLQALDSRADRELKEIQRSVIEYTYWEKIQKIINEENKYEKK